METIKISLAKPIYALSNLDINWDNCEEKDGVLRLVLNNAGSKSMLPGDIVLFRRTGTIESEYPFGSDGVVPVSEDDREMSVIVEQEVKVISAISESEFTVEAPKKTTILCKNSTPVTIGANQYYAVSVEGTHTIFYQDVKMASDQTNPIRAIFGDEPYPLVFATNNELSTVGIASSYTKYTKTVNGCGSNENVPYDYFFIPNRESRTTFLCAAPIPENTMVDFSQNDFYFTLPNGKCIVWSEGAEQTEISVFKRTDYWNVPVGFVQNTDYVHLYQEENINTLFADKIKKNVIPPVINMERVKYAPIIMVKTGDTEEINAVCGITFNLHFRKRDNNWNVRRWDKWNTCGPTESSNVNFERSDSMVYLGFNDNDVQYQKMKVKKSFIRLSFYRKGEEDEEFDPINASLLYYSTIFLDSGYLFGQFNKKRTELIENGKTWNSDEKPSYVLSASSEDSSTIRIDSQIVVHNEFDMTKSSEGFNLYLFADDSEICDQDKEFRTIYMKVEFNHAGYGKTVPFMPWPKYITEDSISIDEYFKNVYIPVKICHIDDRYYYYFNNENDPSDSRYIDCDKDAKSIVFNLFEPRLTREL